MFKNKFKTKPIIETITVGSCLKTKREELGLSLPDLSRELGIKYEYLKSLEEGDYTQLPPQVYVRGFIKSYAKHLDIDASQLVKIYNRETSYLFEEERESRQRSAKAKKSDWKDYLTVTPRILTGIFSLCIVTVLGYYFMHQINSFNSKPYLFVDNPVADGVVKEKDLWVSGKTENDAILKINGQEISVNAEGVFSQKIVLAEGRNLLVVEAKNRFSKTDKKEINIVYEKSEEDKLVVKESEAETVAEPIKEISIVEEKSGTVAGAKTPVEPVKKEIVVKKEPDSVLGAKASAASIEEEVAVSGSEDATVPVADTESEGL
ncbi:MAG: helix-turn-helix domain-containing protein [Candidatus Pacebacteria bacterium]|nr:helix-turn-helix domain-containing protein [Candidatus Paceibacterota bacterium]